MWKLGVALLSLCACTAATEEIVYAPKAIDPPRRLEAADSTHKWKISSLKAHQIPDASIKEMVSKLENGDFPGITSVLLVHKNELVLERYLEGTQRDDLQNMRSASKTITSALVGIALDRGELSSVNQQVLPMFPEYVEAAARSDPRKGEITLAHLMSMTSGVRGNEDAMYPTDDWVGFYFDQPLFADPGKRFSYATSGAVVLGSVVTRASKLRIPDFANRYLFERLGIRSYRWPISNSLGSQGLAMTGGGLHLRPRDMAKFGQLFLNRGVWKGQRIVSEEWVERSTTKHATSDLYGEDYGYFWRMLDRQSPRGDVKSFEAWGNGGQFIMVFPELDLVAVFTGTNYGKMPEMEQPFHLMERFVLPAFVRLR
ncbi:MAG: serine hydrolase [Pseudomonadota bacterium]